jgi:histidinol-phosphatase
MTEDLLDLAMRVARLAGDLAMTYFRTDVTVDTKADQTPVTIADREAEALIRREIAAMHPDHRFLGEEMGSNVGDAAFVWVIDPIDGTKNFIRGLPFFATQLALMEYGRVLVGVSYAPALGELMAARHGQGATLNGVPVRVSTVDTLAQSFVLHGGLDCFVDTGCIPALSELSRQVMSMRGHGDFYGYHLVAQGKVDAMIEASIHPWDIAACKLIVEEAGGRFSGFDGDAASLPPNSIASNGRIHAALLQRFAPEPFER